MVICLERGADLHMAQLMPLPLTISCFSKIQTGFPFLVPAYLGGPGKRAVKRMCVCKSVRPTTRLFLVTTYADNVALPAFACRATVRRAAINRYLLPAGPQLWLMTDRRTNTVPFRRPCSAYYAGSANNDYIHYTLKLLPFTQFSSVRYV